MLHQIRVFLKQTYSSVLQNNKIKFGTNQFKKKKNSTLPIVDFTFKRQ